MTGKQQQRIKWPTLKQNNYEVTTPRDIHKKKKNKKAKEELAGQRQIQYEAEHKRKLVEQANHTVYLVNILNNGISRAYSKAVQIGAAREVVDEMINIKDDYEAVHGAVTEAAPKVFLKYFYVNTKTGEKSGEMLANVKLG